MNKKQLVPLLAALGIAPNKKLGQNFLVDANFAAGMIRGAAILPGDRVLEIGPGFGALTELLLNTGARVAAIECDRKLVSWLRKHFKHTSLRLIEDDACRTDIAAVYGENVPFRLISSLPYSAGTVIIAKMLTLKTPPSEMLVILQKEVGMRLAAAPGDKEYGAISVRVRNIYQVDWVKTVPPDLFYPKPDVESALLRLTIRDDCPEPELRRRLATLVKAAFAHRRKKMFKQTAAVFGSDKLAQAMNSLNISPDIRAEKISPELFLRLAEKLQTAKN